MSKIVTYREGHYSQIKLDSGERILLSVAQSGIVILKLRFLGVVPGPKIAEWLPQDLDRFLALFGGASPGESPFKFTVKRLSSFRSIKDIRAFLLQKLRQTNQPDLLLERAENLVQAAHINAVTMFTPLLDRFPIMRQVDVEHSDFILTVASVFIAATKLNNLRLSDDREENLMEVVAARLDQWKPDGSRGFENCKGFFESELDRLTKAGHEPRFVASDAVGKWIVWNVLGRPPQTDEECMLVRAAGGMVTHAFFDWWDK